MKYVALVLSVVIHALVIVFLPDGEPAPRRPEEPALPDHLPIEFIELPPAPEIDVEEADSEAEAESEAEVVVPPDSEPEPVSPPEPEPAPAAEPKATPKSVPPSRPAPAPPAIPAEPPSADGGPAEPVVADPEAAAPDGPTSAGGSDRPSGTASAGPRALDVTLSNRGRPALASRSGRGGRAAGTKCGAPASKPRPRTKVPVEYSHAARAARLEGRVILRAQVGPDGRVSDVSVLRGLGAEVDGPAAEALRAWTFEPAMACGEPVPSQFTIARDFALGD